VAVKETPDGQDVRRLPGLDSENRAFWTGGAEGRLMIDRCTDCGVFVHPPRPLCPACGGPNTAPTPTSGRGRVASFTINHQPWAPGVSTPYVFAAIELDEQAELYVFTNIVDCPVDEVDIGMEVEVRFERHDDVHLPFFRPVGAQR
jgi:uncharacterized OB-fold protein